MTGTKTEQRRAAQLAWQAAGWVWLAAAWLAGLALVWRFGRALLDSDMASEMVLADLLNKEGGVLSQNWYYSTELRVICQQLLFKLGLLVFPGSWHAARLLAQGLLSALLAASYLFFARGAGLWKSAPWAAGALLCPFGFWQLSEGVELTALLLGIFGIGDLLDALLFPPETKGEGVPGSVPSLRRPSVMLAALRGSLLGFLAGLVPCGAGMTASFASHALEKHLSRHPEQFGKGAWEGLAGPEASRRRSRIGGAVRRDKEDSIWKSKPENRPPTPA